jgi:uncharacterized membrane protein YtjA (UPF0391 family)
MVIAIAAAVSGFGGIVAGAVGAAKVLFVIFLVGAIIAFFIGRRVMRCRRLAPVTPQLGGLDRPKVARA